MSIMISDFYNHQNFMKDVHFGEKLVSESDRKLRNMKPESTEIKVGDKIVATQLSTYLEGTVGKVLEISHNGPFLRFKIKWEVSNIPTYERSSDIKLI